MRIERISDAQIKFILNKEDLSYHNLKIADLAQNSEKMHGLFREMMTQAMLEYDFTADPNTPLIVETVPLPNESIMIVVTKAAGQGYIENKFSFAPKAREERRYRRKPLIETPSPMGENDAPVHIFTFKSLDEAGAAATRLSGGFHGDSSLYKNKNKYFLVLRGENGAAGRSEFERFESILLEYGQKHSSSIIYMLHLDEYGEMIVSNPAVEKLAGIYS
ncbi:MAG: adaptor protein MecA [Clostridiales bacterium]|jgi:adapter protein MecA 1/2|nr:adaptor protein MecA [Clostridiales bacterium]